jgi:hypothetical protein
MKILLQKSKLPGAREDLNPALSAREFPSLSLVRLKITNQAGKQPDFFLIRMWATLIFV